MSNGEKDEYNVKIRETHIEYYDIKGSNSGGAEQKMDLEPIAVPTLTPGSEATVDLYGAKGETLPSKNGYAFKGWTPWPNNLFWIKR